MNETVDLGQAMLQEVEENTNRELHRQSVSQLNNAEQTIMALLRNNEAFKKTIDRLTDAWGEDKEKAMNFAQNMLDEACDELDQNLPYRAQNKAWAQSQMAADNNRVVGKPKLRRAPTAAKPRKSP